MNDRPYYTKLLRVFGTLYMRNKQNLLNNANLTSKTLELSAKKTLFVYLHAVFNLTRMKYG